MKNNKQIFFEHESDKKQSKYLSSKGTPKNALLGFLEFGSEFHTPYTYPLTSEAVKELQNDFQNEINEQKK